ncbi:ankyrin repeat-containing domain protein [Hypoxylon sp. FL1284]|nr:ankyrin repeat-containing domain protein [Hypoxylon sp. FL1284]
MSELLDFLLQKGLDINCKDYFGLTALHHMSKLSITSQVEHLIKLGADVNASDENGLTPLHFACRLDVPFNLEDLDYNNGSPELLQRSRAETCSALLRSGADPSLSDKDGYTPLHYACRYQFPDLVRLLVNHPKVDVKAKAHDRSTPLQNHF